MCSSMLFEYNDAISRNQYIILYISADKEINIQMKMKFMYLVLVGNMRVSADEYSSDSSMPIPSASVQGRVSILKANKFVSMYHTI